MQYLYLSQSISTLVTTTDRLRVSPPAAAAAPAPVCQTLLSLFPPSDCRGTCTHTHTQTRSKPGDQSEVDYLICQPIRSHLSLQALSVRPGTSNLIFHQFFSP